jgi:hypothetical protein
MVRQKIAEVEPLARYRLLREVFEIKYMAFAYHTEASFDLSAADGPVAALGGDVLLASGADLSAIWSLLLKELRKYRKLCLSCGGIDFLSGRAVDYALSIASGFEVAGNA